VIFMSGKISYSIYVFIRILETMGRNSGFSTIGLLSNWRFDSDYLVSFSAVISLVGFS